MAWGRRLRAEWVIYAAVGVVGGLYAFASASLLPEALRGEYFFDVWFQADVPRAVDNLTDRWSNFYRTSVHPAYAALTLPFGYVLAKLGVPPWLVARGVTAIGAGLATALFLIVARRISGRWLDAGIAVAALLASSTFLFWAGVPETYVWGGASVLAVLAVVGSAKDREPNPIAFTIASAASLGVTISNWAIGLIAAALSYSWRRAAMLSAVAFALVAALAAVSVNIVGRPHYFLWFGEDSAYVHGGVGVSLRAIPAFVLSSVVAPQPALIPYFRAPEYVDYLLSFQSPDWSGIGVLGIAATLAWLAALGLGGTIVLGRLWRAPLADRLLLTLMLAIVAQGALHLVYGEETFLYAMHFAPLLVLLALYGAASRFRPVALALIAATAALAGPLNWTRYLAAISEVELAAQNNERAQIRDAMIDRSGDFWPRDEGHVPLGVGLDEAAKAYVEPGGSFSPSVGSFGVSFWVRDVAGAVLRTSDTTPVDHTRSRFLSDGSGVESETPDYVVRWSRGGSGRWDMRLTPKARVEVAIRSVGPAGGPLTTIRRDGDALVLADRWRIESHGLEIATIGVEERGWTEPSRGEPAAEAREPDGWTYAFLRLSAGVSEARLSIVDAEAAPNDAPTTGPLLAGGVSSGLVLDLPDSRFQESIDAQVAQILHGVVGDELRPGDPVNYPLAWQRDAAVQVVALVRAGRADAARVLVRHLAEQDYYGGFGAETDAPGLSLWAIAETARAVDDPAFEAAMAEHVSRKAEDILAFIDPEAEVRRDYLGPLTRPVADLDAHGVAVPSEDGLIHGRMDWHDPYLSLTAISLHGLQEAAFLASRRGDAADAERWSAAAEALHATWREHADDPEMNNERTGVVGLSPTFVAAGLPEFEAALERRWAETRDETGGFRERPLWTYFDIAHARQWAALGRPDRAWATLEYFWASALHPGLYTLWESDHEEGQIGFWRSVRGWSRPKHVTPHYWSSAEMILLQTEMLAAADRTPGAEAIVIGAGVPPEWLSQSMSAQGLITELGRVDWRWEDSVMRVRAPEGVALRLGPAFPEEARIVVEAPT